MGYAENTEKTISIFFLERAPWHQNFFLTDFHQNDIRTDLTDTVPGNDIFLIRTEKTTQSWGTRHDDGTDLTTTLINDQITDLAKLLAVTSVDHIFFF